MLGAVPCVLAMTVTWRSPYPASLLLLYDSSSPTAYKGAALQFPHWILHLRRSRLSEALVCEEEGELSRQNVWPGCGL